MLRLTGKNVKSPQAHMFHNAPELTGLCHSLHETKHDIFTLKIHVKNLPIYFDCQLI